MKEHYGGFAIAAAILLAAVIYAFASRYEISSAGEQIAVRVFILDRWTGKLHPVE